jgi:hypothetical protein
MKNGITEDGPWPSVDAARIEVVEPFMKILPIFARIAAVRSRSSM